jgi:hypothetical protein
MLCTLAIFTCHFKHTRESKIVEHYDLEDVEIHRAVCVYTCHRSIVDRVGKFFASPWKKPIFPWKKPCWQKLFLPGVKNHTGKNIFCQIKKNGFLLVLDLQVTDKMPEQ